MSAALMRRLFVLTFTLAAACGGKGGSNPADAPVTNPDAPITNPDAMMSGVVQCPTAVPAPTDGTCDATAGTGTAVIVRGDVLGDGVVYKDGGVVYDGDAITYV